ncbi:protein SMALL AUXIN UP-REGULATED RNA 51-like [Coffea arabica]|uniref:Protein SMALL AUXIN UP-REGULATED RNA 51-like n=1 Tax=Coffea arabica TaxID=13443 RepID=A0ABM4U1M0_COFAR
MDSKKSNKITEIVRLQQILKKWKKLAAKGTGGSSLISHTGTTSTNNTNSSGGSSNSSKSIKFLKKTQSFSERESSSSLNNGAVSGGSSDVVPKGYLAVCVGEELKRFVIPMEYLGHQAFGILLREAEEEFGFQQEGVLKIPCQVAVFEKILKMMDESRDGARNLFLGGLKCIKKIFL